MPIESYPLIAVCELCSKKRHVRTISLGAGEYKVCAECEGGIEKARERRKNQKPYEPEE